MGNPFFAGPMKDSCRSNACKIVTFSITETRVSSDVLHMNHSKRVVPTQFSIVQSRIRNSYPLKCFET